MEFTVVDAKPPTTVRWPDGSDGPWEVTLTWEFLGDRAECVGVSLQPVDRKSASPITTSLLRALPLAGLVRDARGLRFQAVGGDDVEGLAASPEGEALSELKAEEALPWQERRRGRPKLYDDDFYREVARVYLQARVQGDSPRQAVVDMQPHHVALSTASRWIAAARELGYLSPTSKGRASDPDAVAVSTGSRQVTAETSTSAKAATKAAKQVGFRVRPAVGAASQARTAGTPASPRRSG